MIISIATSFSPDEQGVEQYNVKATELANKIVKELPEAQLFSSDIANEVDKPEWCYKTYIVLPDYLLARKNNTTIKRTLTWLMAQTRKRAITFILLRPLMSTISYKDYRMDACISVGFASECYFFEFIKWVKFPNNIKYGKVS